MTQARNLLTACLLTASIAVAQAQTPSPAKTQGDNNTHHPAATAQAAPAAPAAAAPGGMPMGSAGGPGMCGPATCGMMAGKPAAMGADMGKMMDMMPDMMRQMMAGRGMGGERAGMGMGMPFEHIEGRIAYLKAELKITDAQTAPWNAFADALRANAGAMKTMHEQMGKGDMPGTLPERLAMQQKMMSARLAELKGIEAAATPLYDAFSADQKKLIDQMMSGPMGGM